MTFFHSFMMIPTSYVKYNRIICLFLHGFARRGVPSFWHLLRLYYTISINAL